MLLDTISSNIECSCIIKIVGQQFWYFTFVCFHRAFICSQIYHRRIFDFIAKEWFKAFINLIRLVTKIFRRFVPACTNCFPSFFISYSPIFLVQPHHQLHFQKGDSTSIIIYLEYIYTVGVMNKLVRFCPGEFVNRNSLC